MPTGMQNLFPVYLPRHIQKGQNREDYDTSVAQNENNLNQDLSILYNKNLELDARVAQLEAQIKALQGG